MRKAKVIILCILLGAAAIAAAVYFLKTDEDRIRKQFRKVSDLLGKQPDESQLAMARKMKQLSELVADPVRLKTPEAYLTGEFTPTSFARIAAQSRMRFTTLSVSFDDLDIAFPEDRAAVVRLKVTLTGQLDEGSGINRAFGFECRLQKPERKWLLSGAEVIRWEEE